MFNHQNSGKPWNSGKVPADEGIPLLQGLTVLLFFSFMGERRKAAKNGDETPCQIQANRIWCQSHITNKSKYYAECLQFIGLWNQLFTKIFLSLLALTKIMVAKYASFLLLHFYLVKTCCMQLYNFLVFNEYVDL